MSDIAIMKRRVFSQPILSDMVCHIHHLNMNIWRSAKRDHTIVTVDVTNTGAVAAKHVVELFIEPKMKTRLPRPVRELKAFKKIFLQPGEKKQVCFSLELQRFCIL